MKKPKRKKADVGFTEWIALECRYGDDLLLLMITMGVLAFASFFISFLLFIGVVAGFLAALGVRWRRELADPPWYLKKEENDGKGQV